MAHATTAAPFLVVTDLPLAAGPVVSFTVPRGEVRGLVLPGPALRVQLIRTIRLEAKARPGCIVLDGVALAQLDSFEAG